MDEEREAKEEVDRLDSGKQLHSSASTARQMHVVCNVRSAGHAQRCVHFETDASCLQRNTCTVLHSQYVLHP